MINILIADEHSIVRRGLKLLLEERPEWRICSEVSNGQEAIDSARKICADIAFVDLMMSDLTRHETVLQIREVSPRTKILIFTIHSSQALIHDALAAGARGYLLKTDPEQEAIRAVEMLLTGQMYFSAAIFDEMSKWLLRACPGGSKDVLQLTAREHQILRLLAEGNRNRDIAGKLGISLKTAVTHRTSIMRKIGVHSIVDLVRYAVRNRFIEA